MTRRAFDLLVRKYQHKVVKLVLRYVRNPAEAEDIAQEAFIKAYRALPQFRGDSAFYTWMYRIAINTAKNSLASRDRSPIAYDLDLTDPEESHSVQTKLQDPDTPEGMALTEEIRGIVNSAIEGLPEELKTAIVLRELDGLELRRDRRGDGMSGRHGSITNFSSARGHRQAPARSI